MSDYYDEGRSISERIARRASIDIQTYLETVLPAETQILEKQMEGLRVQLQQADQLDQERWAEIKELEAFIVGLEAANTIANTKIKKFYSELDSAKRSIVLLQDERNTALSKVEEQEAYIARIEARSLIECDMYAVQDQRDEAYDRIKDLEKQISEFLYVDYSDYSRLAKDTTKTIVDLQTKNRKLKLRLSNCAHWSNLEIWCTTQGIHYGMGLIHQEASDAE